MLSATLQRGLTEYAIGGKIRALRLRKKMGLVELGGHTGLSPALLSKIECGRIFPTLPTLLRIALVFSLGLDHFFAGAREQPMLALARKASRVVLPERAGAREVAYRFESLDYGATERRFNAYCAEFLSQPKDRLRPHSHPGVEFLYVLRGTVHLLVAEQDYDLEAGDAIYFDSHVPHAYGRAGTRTRSAIVITAT